MRSYEIYRCTGDDGWLRDEADVFKEEQIRYQRMREFVEISGDE